MRNGPAMFWTGVVTHSLGAAIPVTVFFLSVNRILIISYPVTFAKRHERFLLMIATTCIFGCVIVNFLNFVSSAFVYSYVPLETDCQVFACIADKTGSLSFYTESKFVSGAFNFVAGLILLFKVWKLRARQREQSEQGGETGKKANFIAILAIVTEFSFNFLPQFLVFLLSEIWHISAPTYAGPYNVFFTSVDSLISSLTYARILRPNTSNSSKISTVQNMDRRYSTPITFIRTRFTPRARSRSAAR
ncbi:serpentine type 7TM GPCR chemoreceptor srbc domain-containing protein [Ditylenchus destructor]|uniref:Serpentine type 7TM GPCR chemoreceptor srbc domain-containing protein n=1 Tax=Ditylenchus destructor TaxID=166010 RepID=A0AAD4MHI2_9BILA|nr:serpentine type 7TM GPCR chemoreceptor srbc domain-containing protein [Ditylenchus destructor]